MKSKTEKSKKIPEKSTGKGKRIAFWCIFLSAAFLVTDAVLLLFSGKIWFNNPEYKVYKRMGFIAGEDQGKVLWENVATQNMDFVFLRATEGTSITDGKFSDNFEGAYEAGLMVSPMHDLTIDEDGGEQAENFINAVGELKERQLPCSVRVRLYGEYVALPPEKAELRAVLGEFVDTVYKQYGVMPIIIADEDMLSDYISGGFDGAKYCIESVYSKPDGDEDDIFWLYNPKGSISGCSGDSKVELVTILVSEEEYGKLMVTK